ncbi:hypothetical protein CALCODRAFT_510866 [Calocera cornea HHB12733]|uniref:Uncharacterized protein n=1 Tax=Calocera cornea HHB12733 TaxID=1353952 RepID=A0A165E8G4_9BASI|nr:hypothetical protein CALCODRAFT_510866 [Calocera cornea HHB12733]
MPVKLRSRTLPPPQPAHVRRKRQRTGKALPLETVNEEHSQPPNPNHTAQSANEDAVEQGEYNTPSEDEVLGSLGTERPVGDCESEPSQRGEGMDVVGPTANTPIDGVRLTVQAQATPIIARNSLASCFNPISYAPAADTTPDVNTHLIDSTGATNV